MSMVAWTMFADADWLFVEMMLFHFCQSISDHQIAEDLSEERKEEGPHVGWPRFNFFAGTDGRLRRDRR